MCAYTRHASVCVCARAWCYVLVGVRGCARTHIHVHMCMCMHGIHTHTHTHDTHARARAESWGHRDLAPAAPLAQHLTRLLPANIAIGVEYLPLPADELHCALVVPRVVHSHAICEEVRCLACARHHITEETRVSTGACMHARSAKLGHAGALHMNACGAYRLKPHRAAAVVHTQRYSEH